MAPIRSTFARLLAVVLVLSGGLARAQEATTGQLVIVSSPPGATISIDGARAGHAPLTRPKLLPGEHVVEARWSNGNTATAIARVTAGMSSVVKIEGAPPAPAAPALPETGQLVIASQPAGALITVDGKRAPSAAPVTLKGLAAGQHAITAEWKNGRHATVTAQVVAGSSKVVQVQQPAATTGELVIETDPSGAAIAVDGRKMGASPLSFRDVPIGPHAIVAAWPDGRSARATASVIGDQTVTARVKAPPLPTGELVVTTTPTGATITVDGKPMSGVTPLTLREQLVGQRQLAADWPDGRSAKATATVILGQSVAVHLTAPPPPTGQLVVMTDPTGGEISIDGKKQPGRAPLTVRELPPGVHEVIATFADGRSARATANVVASRSATVSVAAPAPLTGQVVVSTDPPGAQVSLDGHRQTGKSPLAIKDVSTGAHEVAVEWPDGRTARATVGVSAGVSAAVRVAAPAPVVAQGMAVIATEPSGASIVVDGRRLAGRTPLTVKDLAAGPHDVMAEWPNGAMAHGTVSITAGVSSTLRLMAPAAPTATLNVTSEPAGAIVLVDGKKQSGRAPLVVRDLSAGPHEVVAEWTDGRTAHQHVDSVGGLTDTVRLFAPALAAPPVAAAPPAAPGPPPTQAGSKARLVITTEPEGATVLFDHHGAGTAPVTLEAVAPGVHLVTAQWPDGRQVDRNAMVPDEGTAQLRVVAPTRR